MGVKRNIDSGRVDSLGRPIKVSGRAGEKSVDMKKRALGGVSANEHHPLMEHMDDIISSGLEYYDIFGGVDIDALSEVFHVEPEDFSSIMDENPEFSEWSMENGMIDDEYATVNKEVLEAGNFDEFGREVARQLNADFDKDSPLNIFQLRHPSEEMVDYVRDGYREALLDYAIFDKGWAGHMDSGEISKLIDDVDIPDSEILPLIETVHDYYNQNIKPDGTNYKDEPFDDDYIPRFLIQVTPSFHELKEDCVDMIGDFSGVDLAKVEGEVLRRKG